jgi:hypothetical protein
MAFTLSGARLRPEYLFRCLAVFKHEANVYIAIFLPLFKNPKHPSADADPLLRLQLLL